MIEANEKLEIRFKLQLGEPGYPIRTLSRYFYVLFKMINEKNLFQVYVNFFFNSFIYIF